MRNLVMFQKLVGAEQLSNVTLVTTHWNAVDAATGRERMRILGENNNMWGAMLKRGSTMASFDGTPAGAHEILRKILARNRSAVLSIQREMVDQELHLSETAAGKLIREEIGKLQAQHTRQLTDLRDEMKEALNLKDTHMLQLQMEQQMKFDRQLARYQDQIAELEAVNSTQEKLRNSHHEQLKRLEHSLGDRLQFLEEQNAPPPPSYVEIQSKLEAQGGASHQDASVARSTPGRSLLTASVEIFRQLLRPRVPLGYRRLEWTCVSHFPPPPSNLKALT